LPFFVALRDFVDFGVDVVAPQCYYVFVLKEVQVEKIPEIFFN
jgi:hypothetical protein